jgi:hypothetical protein
MGILGSTACHIAAIVRLSAPDTRRRPTHDRRSRRRGAARLLFLIVNYNTRALNPINIFSAHPPMPTNSTASPCSCTDPSPSAQAAHHGAVRGPLAAGDRNDAGERLRTCLALFEHVAAADLDVGREVAADLVENRTSSSCERGRGSASTWDTGASIVLAIALPRQGRKKITRPSDVAGSSRSIERAAALHSCILILVYRQRVYRY